LGTDKNSLKQKTPLIIKLQKPLNSKNTSNWTTQFPNFSSIYILPTHPKSRPKSRLQKIKLEKKMPIQSRVGKLNENLKTHINSIIHLFDSGC
jgi:hypothetical protein